MISLSFKRAWERAATGPAAWLLEPLATVDATDPYTLRVALVRGDCELLQRMIHPAFSPVPPNAGPATDRAYNNLPIGNGPFKMDGVWQHDSYIRLIRNDDYAGRADWAQLPALDALSSRSGFEPGDALVAAPVAGVSFLLPAVTTKPLDSVVARKAISLAIDRETIAREAFADHPVPAASLVPPPLRALSAPSPCDACRFDPAEARRLAKIAGLAPGTVLHFRYNDRAQHETWSSAVKRQLESTLGIKVNYYNLPFAALLANERAPGVSGISRSAWGLDYPSRGNILAPLPHDQRTLRGIEPEGRSRPPLAMFPSRPGW